VSNPEEVEGECWTGSIAASRPGVYRCAAGNGIADPCFAIPGDRSAVVCGARPGDEKCSFRLRLVKPLPVEKPSGKPRPWIFELADGIECSALTGTMQFTADEVAPWTCDRGLYILGEPRRGKVWTVKEVEFADDGSMPLHVLRSRSVAVRTVWE